MANLIVKSVKSDWVYDDLRECLIDRLADHPQWRQLQNSLKANQPFVNWISGDQAMSVSSILCVAGQAARDPEHHDQPIDYDPYLAKVISPLVEKGELHDGSKPGEYDDRKVRWSDCLDMQFVDAGTMRLAIGPTIYPLCQKDIKRERIDALRLMIAGLAEYQDPYAFFARGMGVVVIPLTVEGHTFIGRRYNTTEYNGLLSFVSGWASFSCNINEIDFYRDAAKELFEEVRLDQPIHSDRLKFAGLAGQPLTGEADLVFVAQTELGDAYFDGVDWPEHESWLSIRSADDAKGLLSDDNINNVERSQSIMFSSRFGLEYLINHHWSA